MDSALIDLSVENVDMDLMSTDQLVEMAISYETRLEPLPVDLQTRLLEAGIDASSFA